MKARLINDARQKGSSGGPVPTGKSGFTVLELITAMTILLLMVGLLSAAVNQASKAWTTSENRVETFTDARAALDLMSREISKAITTTQIPFLAQESTTTLGNIATIPTLYSGNIAFVAPVGSGASDGMDLMEVVYRLSQQSAGVATTPPAPNPFTNSVPPYQLVRRVTPYSSAVTATWLDYSKNTIASVTPWDFYVPASAATWPETSDTNRTAVIAENVMSLKFAFEDATTSGTPPGTPSGDSLGNPYWNSTAMNAWQNELGGVGVDAGVGANMLNRAPSRVIIALTVLDSRAAVRYNATSDPNARERIYNESQRTFYTSVYIPNHQP